jgi:nucleotide-binding universal stress UspA family protein
MDERPIVVGIDGSPGSRGALCWAARLATTLGAQVVAVHAVGLLDERHAPGSSAAQRRAELQREAQAAWCAPLRQAGAKHRVEMADGNPVDVLLRSVAATDAQLVATGARGVGDNTALALGSTSLHVVQSSPVPVLVVPSQPGPEGPTEPDRHLELARILVGVDRSEPALAALGLAADLAAVAGASLTVLEVVEDVSPFPLGPSTTVTSEGEEEAPERAMALLEAAAGGVRERGVPVQFVVRSGEPASTLVELAEEIDVDLVVVGTRGRGGPDQLLLGSVSRTVADRARRPTLVVPTAPQPAGAAPRTRPRT